MSDEIKLKIWDEFYAHTDPRFPNDASKWEPLFTARCKALSGAFCAACESLDRFHGHLNKVAWWAAKFAEDMFPARSEEAKAARALGRLAGLWHDLGKFAEEFQFYLRSAATAADPHRAEIENVAQRRVDHSTAGARHAAGLLPFGPLLSYLIAGHHAGLPDAVHLFYHRFKRQTPDWNVGAQTCGLPGDEQIPTPPNTSRELGMPGLAFLVRMLFSCLVDADFLATEAFMSPDRGHVRKPWPPDILARMTQGLDAYLAAKFDAAASRNAVDAARNDVRAACVAAAQL